MSTTQDVKGTISVLKHPNKACKGAQKFPHKNTRKLALDLQERYSLSGREKSFLQKQITIIVGKDHGKVTSYVPAKEQVTSVRHQVHLVFKCEGLTTKNGD